MKRITKGKALILAREDKGPATHVQLRGKEHCILREVGGPLIASGLTWERALAELRKVPNA